SPAQIFSVRFLTSVNKLDMELSTGMGIPSSGVTEGIDKFLREDIENTGEYQLFSSFSDYHLFGVNV
ncbi:MAG TPA: hypothetical protein VJ911_01925, partial [Cryomorphaceae bacterium]|nr:hypothetical protein [Cryomorphaceae bacterium]